jgi:hypothetical protein
MRVRKPVTLLLLRRNWPVFVTAVTALAFLLATAAGQSSVVLQPAPPPLVPPSCNVGTYRANVSETAVYKDGCPGFPLCEPGFACRDLVKAPCPPGMFTNEYGSGTCRPCDAGYRCQRYVDPLTGSLLGSTSPRQLPCTEGGASDAYCPEGSSEAIPVASGYYATPENQPGHHTGQEICPVGHYCPLYNGGLPCNAAVPTITPTPPPPKPGYFYPTPLVNDIVPTPTFCGANEYCADGTRIQLAPRCRPGGVDTRSLGIKIPCPLGTYGELPGLTLPTCSGPCGDGMFCPPGTASPNRLLLKELPSDFCLGNSSKDGRQSGLLARSLLYSDPEQSEKSDFKWTRNEELASADQGVNTRDGSSVALEGGMALEDPYLYSDAVTTCPKGCYCDGDGTLHACPAGRAGEKIGEMNSQCSTECEAGYWCPPGSTSPRQLKCSYDSVPGSSGLVMGSSLTGRTDGFGGTSRQNNMRYCPKGSAFPLFVPPGFVTAGGDEYTRITIQPCVPGTYCAGSMVRNCSAGLYGASYGESSPRCTGPCARGWLCGPRSVEASTTACGSLEKFCPQQSFLPVKQAPGWITAHLRLVTAADASTFTDSSLGSVATSWSPYVQSASIQQAESDVAADEALATLEQPGRGLMSARSSVLAHATSREASIAGGIAIRATDALKKSMRLLAVCSLTQAAEIPAETYRAQLGLPLAEAGEAEAAAALASSPTAWEPLRVIQARAAEFSSRRTTLDRAMPQRHPDRTTVPLTLLYSELESGPRSVTVDSGLLCEYAVWAHEQDKVEKARLKSRYNDGTGGWIEGYGYVDPLDRSANDFSRSGINSGRHALDPLLLVYASFGNVDNDTALVRDIQIPCEPGHYCKDSVVYECPRGTYSAEWAARGPETCTLCEPGYYCPPASVKPLPCGEAHVYCPGYGNDRPLQVPTGYYSTRELPDPINYLLDGSGNYVNASVLGYEDAMKLNATIRERERSTRNHIRICPAGTWCREGIAYLCNPGRFGNQEGDIIPDCDGPCEEGYACGAGNINPQQRTCVNETYYCPTGSNEPVKVTPGYYTVKGRTTDNGGKTSPLAPLLCNQTYSTEGYFGIAAAKPEYPTSVCAGIPFKSRQILLANPAAGPNEYEQRAIDARPAADGILVPANGLAGTLPLITDCLVERSPLLGPMIPLPAPPAMRYRACTSGYIGDFDTRSAQVPCEAGHFCTDGLRFECPAGRYGTRVGESSSRCEGDCPAGYICGWATTNPYLYECGDPRYYCPAGSAAPTPVDFGYYADPTEPPTRKTYQRLCEPGFYCVDAERFPCPPGHYQPLYGMSSPLACLLSPAGFFTPFYNHSNPTDYPCGMEKGASVYCPTGSTIPTPVTKGYFSIGGFQGLEGLPENTTRLSQLPCGPGWYCQDGIARQCPAGKYGATSLLSTTECSGDCEKGHFCPPGSTSPTQYRCGDIYVFLTDLFRLLRPPVDASGAGGLKTLEIPNPARSMLMDQSDYEIYESPEAKGIGSTGTDGTIRRGPGSNGSAIATVVANDLGLSHDYARASADLFKQLQEELLPTDALLALDDELARDSVTGSYSSPYLNGGGWGADGGPDRFLYSLLARGASHDLAAKTLPKGNDTLPINPAAYGCALLSAADSMRAVTQVSWVPREIDSGGQPRVTIVLTIANVGLRNVSQGPEIEGSGFHSAECAKLGYNTSFYPTPAAAADWDGKAIHVNVSYPWSTGIRLKLPSITMAVDSLVPLHRMLIQGGPSAVYCPAGSAFPQPVPLGHYSINTLGNRYAPLGRGDGSPDFLSDPYGDPHEHSGENVSTPSHPNKEFNDHIYQTMRDEHWHPAVANMTRDAVVPAEPGFYAVAGVKHPCQAGLYGATSGLSTRRCSGACPAGHQCKLATAVPDPCPDNTFSPSGSWICIPCFSGAEALPSKQGMWQEYRSPVGRAGKAAAATAGSDSSSSSSTRNTNSVDPSQLDDEPVDFVFPSPVDPSSGYLFDPDDAVRLVMQGAPPFYDPSQYDALNSIGVDVAALTNGAGELNRRLSDWEFPSVIDSTLSEGDVSLPSSPVTGGQRCKHSRSCCGL